MRCSGRKDGGTCCTSTVYKCKKCGSVGCAYGNTNCSNKNFDVIGQCLKCGSREKEELR
jgi:hypothetical protein